MEWSNEWLASDKLQHVLACLLIALVAMVLASQSSYSFLYHCTLALGCAASLAVDVTNEASNKARFLGSSGASPKDATADLLGAAITVGLIGLTRHLCRWHCNKACDADTVDGDIFMV